MVVDDCTSSVPEKMFRNNFPLKLDGQETFYIAAKILLSLTDKWSFLHTEKEVQGTGIALIIISRIIRLHGGNFEPKGCRGRALLFYSSRHL